MDEYNTLFTLFITFLSIERFLSIIRGMMLLSFESGALGVLEGIYLNLVFYDYSIGIDVFFDDPFFDLNKFINNLNYIAHGINVIPLINNFAII